ncbi:DUF5082 family protein [Listeria welshimeri]|uniref:YwqH-like family protein n=1 Tax=Listeria welshimeri TaxID=1643 RepID=UPI001626257D|nr:DUF5082 family protein [Listeria welshimeri]MBC2377633.1 DUF5082 domain-containing protein [Listeria welshimeri]MBF2450231.1 DUF5082 family protein [Listeria welshimeri]MBF2460904.1 DUF5082 family protein [Listeria welshimeri]MBF2683391.1 DUF5082 family protein [Listeria welshimeri]
MEKAHLISKKRNKQRELSSKEAELGHLDRQISQLKEIKIKLVSLKEDVKAVKKNVKSVVDEKRDYWKGDLNDEWKDNTKNNLIEAGLKAYIDKVDTNLDEVNIKIMELENEKYNTEGFIGDLKSGINWLGTQIENLFN